MWLIAKLMYLSNYTVCLFSVHSCGLTLILVDCASGGHVAYITSQESKQHALELNTLSRHQAKWLMKVHVVRRVCRCGPKRHLQSEIVICCKLNDTICTTLVLPATQTNSKSRTWNVIGASTTPSPALVQVLVLVLVVSTTSTSSVVQVLVLQCAIVHYSTTV
jgi:hypothetical protein